MPDDGWRAGGSMWLDALLYDSRQGHAELLIADGGDGVEEDPRSNPEVNRQVL